MHHSYEEDEIIVDFKKALKILEYRKFLIIKTISIFIIFFVILTFILPPKYRTTASLYINKANVTNLAELNPYIISSTAGMNGGYANIISGSSYMLQNEIELMKSSLVIDNVIKENNMKYKSGPEKGQYISASKFFKGDIDIKTKKDASVITIVYSSKKPELSYNVVKSIIKNYQLLNETINLQKAFKDKKLLEESYLATDIEFHDKLNQLKNSSTILAPVGNMGALAALQGHNKSVEKTIQDLQLQTIESQKQQIELTQDMEKLKLIKSKLEWTNLVKSLSKNSSNFLVIKEPALKKDYEKSSPNLLINLLRGLILGFLVAILLVLYKEKTDKVLIYSSLGENIIYNNEQLDLLKLFIQAKSDKNFLLIDFNSKNVLLNKLSNLKVLNSSNIQEILKELNNDRTNYIILSGKIGITDRKSYLEVKSLCKDLQKNIFKEIII